MKVRAFDHAIKGILDTPRLWVRDAPWTFVTMVTKPKHDVPMYLLALANPFIGPLAKGESRGYHSIAKIPEAAKEQLREHINGIEFAMVEDIQTGECQRGGTWERVLYIADRAEKEYVIQMDYDILTVADRLDEVIYCCENNIPFAISDGFFDLQPMLDAARVAVCHAQRISTGCHGTSFSGSIQAQDKLQYVRGSSGNFAGFCKGGPTRADLTKFHKELEKLVGESRFREWGTEQCASNFAIANSLPTPLSCPTPNMRASGVRCRWSR